MGADVSRQEQSNRTDSKSKLSSLAKTQESILKNRESLFQNFYVPAMKEVISGFDPDSVSGSAQMGLASNEINNSFDSLQKQTGQKLFQQNLSGTGAGLALSAANDRARSSALANAYASQVASSNEKKASALASFGSLMPQTTTAAPVVDRSSSRGSGSTTSVGGGVWH